MTVVVLRVAAAQATLDLYRDKPLVWGQWDCARMAAHCVRQLGVTAPLSRFGRYTTALGAQKALKQQGFDNLADAVDSLGLLRIPPASALPADILGFDDGEGGVALAVHLASERILGFYPHPDGRMIAGVLRPTAYLYAWRVL